MRAASAGSYVSGTPVWDAASPAPAPGLFLFVAAFSGVSFSEGGPVAKPEKAAAIAELTDKFRNSGAAVLTEYRGLTVAQLTTLRSSIREHATYAVVKNTLTQIAAKEAGVTAFDGQFSGPSAIAFITGDPVGAAKGLRDFAKANPLLVIKAGVLDGKALTPAEISKLADLESREVLLAKLAGAMKASLSNAVNLFAAPLSQTARVIDALRAKVEAESPAPVAQDTVVSQDTVEAPAEAVVESTEDVATGGDES
jgi:large subunit ribosomal protein L10